MLREVVPQIMEFMVSRAHCPPTKLPYGTADMPFMLSGVARLLGVSGAEQTAVRVV